MKDAKPYVLGILNMLLPGLGYVFLPSRRIFGWLLFIGTLLSLMARRLGTVQNSIALVELFSLVFMTLGFGVDAFLQAKEYERAGGEKIRDKKPR